MSGSTSSLLWTGDWNRDRPLVPPGGYKWLPKKMLAERVLIAKSIERVWNLRKKADELGGKNLTAWKINPNEVDRREYFIAVAKALEAEISVWEALEIYMIAQNQFVLSMRGKIQNEILEIEQEARRFLGIDETTTLPLAMLQTNPRWHEVRKSLLSVPDSEQTCDIINSLTAAQRELTKFRSFIPFENQRLEDYQRGRRREVERLAHSQNEALDKSALRVEQEERARALLE